MTGAEEEVEILGHKLERRLLTMTRTLVRRHRARIERVAAALLRKTTLSRREIDRIAGRSIDDVKPNAPFLLAKAMETKRKGRKVNR
jgi:hypothetical protein